MTQCQIYLVSPLDVAGAFPQRLARALDVDTVELVGDELTRLDRADLLLRAQNEMSRKSNEEIRAWLRMARVAPR